MNLVIPGGVPVDTLGASENRVDTPCQGRVPVLSMLAQELAANHQHRRGVLKFRCIKVHLYWIHYNNIF